MLPIPDHIERYLSDAAFSSTEILVLRQLFYGKQMSLRELGKVTGKSTGVLGQAVKKLMSKGIVQRCIVNSSPKFGIASFEALKKWFRSDLKRKWESSKRKQCVLEAFIDEAKLLRSRPDVRYFEGEDGMRLAFRELIDTSGDLLVYFPHIPDPVDALRTFNRGMYGDTKEKGHLRACDSGRFSSYTKVQVLRYHCDSQDIACP